MTDFKVTYAGYDITEFLIVTSLDRGLLPELEHDQRKIGLSDGYEHFSTSIGKKKIPMGFILRYDLIAKRRKLAEIFMQREPQPLVFSDEPDYEWYAVPTGDIGVDENAFLGKGSIDWVVPDGVAHEINPHTYSNIITNPNAENLMLDPNFEKKNKYWKSWAVLLNEQYNGSNILRGDFSTPSAGANDPAAGNWFQVNGCTTRTLPNLQVGDKVSFAAAFRIIEESTMQDTAKLILEEWSRIGETLLKRHTITLPANNVGTWQTLMAQGVSITDSRTKALNLALGVYDGGIVDISKPQWNLGETLKEYTVPTAQVSDAMVVSNTGSYESSPIIRCRMNGENGFVGLVNSDGGVLQFGNPEETDTKQGQRSDKVLDIPMRNNGSYFTVDGGGITTYPNYVGDVTRPNLAQGSISWTLAGDGMTPVFSTGSATAWHGPRARITSIPRNFENKNIGDFKFENRINFDTNAKKRGRMELVVGSGTSYIMAMVVRDSNALKDEIIVEFWTIRGLQKSVTIDRKKFYGAYFGVNMSRIGQQLELRFTRPKQINADKVVSTSAEERFTITCPEAFGLPVTEVSCWFQRFQTTNHVGMNWWDSKFTWINTPTTTNIPNLFNDGDLLEIDPSVPSVSLNGDIVTDLHALGNEWDKFAIEPGNETIQLVSSSWANMFECEFEVKGAKI